MPEKYAVLTSLGDVINVVLWDGDTQTWSPPDGQVARICPDGVGKGWRWVDDTWLPPEDA